MLLTEIADDADTPLVWDLLLKLLSQGKTVLVSDNLNYKLPDRPVSSAKFDDSIFQQPNRPYVIYSVMPAEARPARYGIAPSLRLTNDELETAKLKKVGDHFELYVEIDNEGN
jgi:hypothetical protein